MPALILFNRKTNQGSDDLQPGSTITILFRLFEMCLLIPIILHFQNEINHAGSIYSFLFPEFDEITDDSKEAYCHSSYQGAFSWFPILSVLYTILLFLGILLGIFLEYTIIKKSSIGTPTEPQLRIQVAKVIQFKMVFIGLLHFIICCVGVLALIFVHEYYHCSNINMTDHAIFLALFTVLVIFQVIQFSWNMVYAVRLFSYPKYGVGVLFESSASSTQNSNHSTVINEAHYMGPVEDMWERRCKVCCRLTSMFTFGLFGGKELDDSVPNGLYADIARVLADYFEDGGVLDIVPSDVIAGLVMLQREQKVRRYKARRVIYRSSSELLQRSSTDLNSDSIRNYMLRSRSAASYNSNLMDYQQVQQKSSPRGEFQNQAKALNPFREMDRFLLAEGARYVRFALAIYSWMLYVYIKPCTGLCQIGCSCCNTRVRPKKYKSHDANHNSCSQQQFIPPIIHGDNRYHAHVIGFLLHLANLDQQYTDIVYAQFHNGIDETPYAIIIDHACSTIVLTIRGSLSLEDCVIDALVDPVSLEKIGKEYGFDGTDQYCHNGIYTRAVWIKRDLEQHGLLECALEQYSSYMLRVVGHSLGAGCGAILAFMLRPTYPNLRCCCFSPPGGMLSWKLATESKDFITSYVLDTELVPRLSVASMEQLRDEVLSLIARISVPKIQVLRHLLTGVSSIFFTEFSIDEGDLAQRESNLITMNESLLYPKDSTPNSVFLQQYQQFKIIQAERKQHRRKLSQKNIYKSVTSNIPLFPPGRMIHFVKTSENIYSSTSFKTPKKCCFGVKKCLCKCITCGTSNVGSEYTPIFISNDSLDEIVVSPTMGTDHFPDRVCVEIEKYVYGQFFISSNNIEHGRKMSEKQAILELLNSYNHVDKVKTLFRNEDSYSSSSETVEKDFLSDVSTITPNNNLPNHDKVEIVLK